MNRPIAAAFAVLVLLAVPAGAHAFALQLSFPGGGWMWPEDPDFQKVYDRGTLGGAEIAADVEFWQGLAATVLYRRLETTAKSRESLVDFTFREEHVQFGPTYRFKYVGWVYPYVSARLFYTSAWERVSDGVFVFKMFDELGGLHAEIGAEFYPFYWARGGAPGLGAYLGAYYQAVLFGGRSSNPARSDRFGAIDDLGGFGLRLGMTYRWDWDMFKHRGPIFGKKR
jgi:hypothetical protein